MNIVFFTGSGLSAESGLQTFRDADGYWSQYSVEDIATLDGWYRNTELVLDFYNKYRKLIEKSEPNHAHVSISKFIEDNPQHKITVITQNVDDLLERAGVKNVIHVHGSIKEAKTTFKGFVQDIGYNDIKVGDKGEDGSQLRPNIVWFGENIYHLEDCAVLTEECNIFCIIGTSLQVYPASSLVSITQPRTKLFVLDPNANKIELEFKSVKIRKTAVNGIDDLLSKINKVKLDF
jgi:NAD-dependent deacetylase